MKRLIIALILFTCASITHAQDNGCDGGLPCGPIPWALPQPPQLTSPTPRPVDSGNPEFTNTPVPTATPVVTLGNVDGAFATLQALTSATPITIVVSGTPMSPDQALVDLTEDTTLIFGYARGMTDLTFGPFTPFIGFMFTILFVVIAVKLLGFLLPLFAVIWGIFRKVFSLILDFLPL